MIRIFVDQDGLQQHLERQGWRFEARQIEGQGLELVRWQAPPMKQANSDDIPLDAEKCLSGIDKT